jgi:alpha-ketoglutarate-dependent 2,4-dichlorophenoxyacetate dioxygenase
MAGGRRRLHRVCAHVVPPYTLCAQRSVGGVPLRVKPLTPGSQFGCTIDGIALACSPLDPATVRSLAAAFTEHSVLVFRGNPLSDAQQVDFTRQLAQELGTTLEPVHVVGGLQDVQAGDDDSRFLSKISNLNVDGQPIAVESVKAIYNAGNQLWHSDSSFKKVSAMASCLAARTPTANFIGGETEFVSQRLALSTLPPLRVGSDKISRADLQSMTGVHDLGFSRGLLVAQWGVERPWAAELPPSRHPLIAQSLSSWSTETLFIGAHLSTIEGMGLHESRELIRQLNTHATQPAADDCTGRLYRHTWQQDDLVIYDNRCCLHRGRPWVVAKGAPASLARDMVRTTLMGRREESDMGYLPDAEAALLSAPDRPERLKLLKAAGVDFTEDEYHGGQGSYYAKVTPDLAVPATSGT